jgi:DNA polymerase
LILDDETFNSIFGAPVTREELEDFEAYIARTDKDKKVTGMWEDADLALKTQWVNSWKQVNGFRKTNPKIVALWDEMQRDCTRSAGKSFIVELPSGRELRYFNVKSNPSLSAEVVLGERRNYLFGAKLVENLVQATARDVFVDGMVRLHEAGYQIAFHVHDEYVLEADSGTEVGPIQALVDQVPEWLPGCPIGSEAVVSDKYLK